MGIGIKNIKWVLLIAVACESQTTSVQIIHSQWGTKIHRPNAIRRAMFQQEANSCASEPPDICSGILSEGTDAQRLDNRQRAATATLKLPEVTKVQITRTAIGNFIVIILTDVDGNQASIWTGGTDENKLLPVTGVEPY